MGKNGSLGYKPRTGVYTKCGVCGKEIYLKPSHAAKTAVHYCSRECKWIASENKVAVECSVCGKTVYRAASTVKWHDLRGQKNFYCSQKCKGIAFGLRNMGENNAGWKGGTSRYSKYGYHSKSYKELRKRVFERDNNTCQYCGSQSDQLELHHIFSFHHFPEFRFTDENCITLCHSCHQTTKQHHSNMRLQTIEKEGQSETDEIFCIEGTGQTLDCFGEAT